MWPFKKKFFKPNPEEQLLLDSLTNDVWMITQGSTNLADHYTLRRNGIELSIALKAGKEFTFFDAKVNGHEIVKYHSVGVKCKELVNAKFGHCNIEALLKKELGKD